MTTIGFYVDEVLPQMQTVAGVLSSKPVIPILDNALISVRGEKLTVTGSDNDLWLTIQTTAVNTDNVSFDFCVDMRGFLSMLKGLSGMLLTLAFDDVTHMMEGTYENGTFKMPYTDVTEYPMPSVEDIISASGPPPLRIDGSFLVGTLGRMSYAVATDVLRPVMTGIHCDLHVTDGPRMELCASDGHKLVRVTDCAKDTEDDTDSTPVAFTMTSKFARVLVNVAQKESTFECCVNDRQVLMQEVGKWQIVARLIEGRYPAYNSVIPKESSMTATLNKDLLMSAIKRVMPLGDTAMEMVMMEFGKDADGGVVVTVRTENGDYSTSAKEQIRCEGYEGADIKIAFKGSFLLQTLNSIPCDSIRMCMTTADRAATFCPSTQHAEWEYLSLLMPVRTGV